MKTKLPMTRTLRSLCIFTALAAAPAFGVVSYHDLANGATATANVTNSHGNGSATLLDYATGDSTGVTVTIASGGSGTNVSSSTPVPPFTGDFQNLFAPTSEINYGGSLYIGSGTTTTGTWTLTFSGLTEGNAYDIAILADRAYFLSTPTPTSSQLNRWASFTLQGAASFTNASSTDGDVNNSVISGANTQLRNGDAADGFIIRYSNIIPTGNTLSILVTGINGREGGYAGNALRFESTPIPEPSAAGLAGLGVLGLLLRRRSR